MVFSEYVSAAAAAAATATAFSRSVDQGASRNRDTAPYVRLLYEVATTIAQNLLREAKKENLKNGLHEVVMKSDSLNFQHDC